MIRRDKFIAVEQGMDSAAEIADAFAVNDSDFEDCASPAFVDVFGDQFFDIFRIKIVQVEDAVDGIFDWVVV